MGWGKGRDTRQAARKERREGRQAARKDRLSMRADRQKQRQGFLQNLAPQILDKFAPGADIDSLDAAANGGSYEGPATKQNTDDSTESGSSFDMKKMMPLLAIGAAIFLMKK